MTLPRSPRVNVRRAERTDLPKIIELAQRALGRTTAKPSVVADVHARNASNILCFERRGDIDGAWAMLALNSRGLKALLIGELDTLEPDVELLASEQDKVSAVYVWAVVAPGPCSEGIRHVSVFLRQPQFKKANLYTRPVTKAGEHIVATTGFQPIVSDRSGLHQYVRMINRIHPSAMGASKEVCHA
jgi:hypothetical protein